LIVILLVILVIAVATNDHITVVNADKCNAQLTAPVSQPTFTSSYVLVQIPVSVNCSANVGQTYAGAAATDTSSGTIVLAQGSVLDSVDRSGVYAGSVVLRFPSSASQGDEIQIIALIYIYDAATGLGSHLATASETWEANFSLPVYRTQSRSSSGCNPSTDGACCPDGSGYSNAYCPGYVNNGAGCLYPSGTPFYEMPGTCSPSTLPTCPFSIYVNGYCTQYQQVPLCSQPTTGLIECLPSRTGQQYCYQTNIGVYSCYPYINNPPYYPYYNPRTYLYPCYLSDSIYYCY